MPTFSHLSPKVGQDEEHKESEPTMLSFSETMCWPRCPLPTLFCMILLTVILLIEKWTERSSNLCKQLLVSYTAVTGADSRSLLLRRA